PDRPITARLQPADRNSTLPNGRVDRSQVDGDSPSGRGPAESRLLRQEDAGPVARYRWRLARLEVHPPLPPIASRLPGAECWRAEAASHCFDARRRPTTRAARV